MRKWWLILLSCLCVAAVSSCKSDEKGETSSEPVSIEKSTESETETSSKQEDCESVSEEDSASTPADGSSEGESSSSEDSSSKDSGNEEENSHNVSEGLAYTLNDDRISYSVTGVGTCTDTDIIIPAQYEGLPVTTIGEWAFWGRSSLTSIEIPDSITTIGSSAFNGCTNLTFNEYENCQYFGNESNPYHVLIKVKDSTSTSYTIHEDTKVIAGSVFQYCSSLTSVVIPDSVTTIGSYAFANCDVLTSMVIPDSVTTIGEGAFYWCDSLTFNEYENGQYLGNGSNPYHVLIMGKDNTSTSYTIHEDTKVIAGRAFFNCRSLTSVEIGDSVTTIGDRAFCLCSSLTSVVIPGSVTTIGSYAFSSCDSLTSITVGENNTAYQSIDGNLYTKDGTTLMQYAIGKTATEFIIPHGVTTIGYSAFSGCRSLTSVEIGDSVTTIGDEAFFNCSSLTSVEIGDSVTTIGDRAFMNCSSLTSVVIPDSVTTIGSSAFDSCSSLTSIVIPDSVTSIAYGAFFFCDSLTELYYKGTESDWEKVSIGDYNTELTNATRYYYSETEPTVSGNYWHYVDGVVTKW